MASEGMQLVRAFFELCLLRRRPQDFPASPLLLGLAMALHLATGIASGVLNSEPAVIFVIAPFTTGMLAVFVTAVLRIAGRPQRVMQTLTALAGSGVILSIISLPLEHWLLQLRQNELRSPVAESLWIVLFVWSLFVGAHIFRHALNTRLFFGFVLAVGYVWLMLNAIAGIYEFLRANGAGTGLALI